jgi:hypothetical protein
VKQQIQAWQKAARQHTLSVSDILQQLQSSLHQMPVTPATYTALTADIGKLFTLLQPVLDKLDPTLSQQIKTDLAHWQSEDNQEQRHLIARDLNAVATYFQQEQ